MCKKQCVDTVLKRVSRDSNGSPRSDWMFGLRGRMWNYMKCNLKIATKNIDKYKFYFDSHVISNKEQIALL